MLFFKKRSDVHGYSSIVPETADRFGRDSLELYIITLPVSSIFLLYLGQLQMLSG